MSVFKQCLRNKKFILSAIILIPLLFIAVFGNFIISHDPLEIHSTQTLEAPSAEYPMGTDEYGRCIACRLIVGIQPTMIVAFGGAIIAMVAGSFLGLLAGYVRDSIGNVIMRVVEIILCFPSILLAMMVVGLWGSGVTNLVLVVGILYTPHFARIAYSSTRKLRKMEYVESQQLLGASTLRILGKTLLPNIVSSLIIQFSLTVANGILLESGLSFLGLGVQPPEPSWGQMIGSAKAYIATNAQYMFWPALFLCLTILATNLMGDALRDVLDPKLKKSF
ncbi:MAG: ABC transporter permease [Lachnospiraceae bacterium]|nr:ABC transporter permease [Lachnospiraceae bacterium]